jgi:hypothetical protein
MTYHRNAASSSILSQWSVFGSNDPFFLLPLKNVYFLLFQVAGSLNLYNSQACITRAGNLALNRDASKLISLKLTNTMQNPFCNRIESVSPQPARISP